MSDKTKSILKMFYATEDGAGFQKEFEAANRVVHDRQTITQLWKDTLAAQGTVDGKVDIELHDQERFVLNGSQFAAVLRLGLMGATYLAEQMERGDK